MNQMCDFSIQFVHTTIVNARKQNYTFNVLLIAGKRNIAFSCCSKNGKKSRGDN